jgi:hypothetical protein
MDQSSGGSGNPSRMTLTVICLPRKSSDMRENYSMHVMYIRMRILPLFAPLKCFSTLSSEFAIDSESTAA